jgi:hypothetical protein
MVLSTQNAENVNYRYKKFQTKNIKIDGIIDV